MNEEQRQARVEAAMRALWADDPSKDWEVTVEAALDRADRAVPVLAVEDVRNGTVWRDQCDFCNAVRVAPIEPERHAADCWLLDEEPLHGTEKDETA